MAKHCSVCNQDYADELAACPHCASAKKTHLAGRGGPPTTQLADRGDDRTTRLADIGAAEEEAAPPPSEAAAAEADEELVGELAAEEAAPEVPESGAEAEMVELSDTPPQPEEQPADSAVDLGGPQAELAASDSGAIVKETASGEAEAFMAELASNAGPGDSGVDFAEGEGVEAAADDAEAASAGEDAEEAAVEADTSPESSAVDLGAAAEKSGESSAVQGGEAVEAHDSSGIDLEDLGEPAAEGAISDLALESLREPARGEASAEEEGAVAEEGAAAEEKAEAEEEKKPAKPAKERSRIPALAGATVLGILIGAGGMFGAQALMGPGEKVKAPRQLPVPPQPKQPTFEMQAAFVASGDWEQAQAAGIDQVPGANPKELVARGEYRLGTILKNVGSKINPQDPALEPALQDLQKAAEQKDANAVYDLALIKELAGQLPAARAEYAKGVQTFANDPVQKKRFESAIDRVDLKAAAQAGGAAMNPLPEGVEDRAVLLALLALALQQQPAPPPEKPDQQPGQAGARPQEDAKEAGFEFWQAAKLAKQSKFPEAIAALERARKLHNQRRFTRLRKAQNPLSDPAEDIFLRCCDELKRYWQLQEGLRGSGYLTDKNTPPQALQALVQNAMTSATKAEDLMDKLAAAKKDADTKIAELKKMLLTVQGENTKLGDKLKTAEKTIKDDEDKLKTAAAQEKKLKEEKDDLNTRLQKIAADLADAKLLDPKGKGNVGTAVKKALEIAKIKDPQGMIRQQRGEIVQLSASLKQRLRPQEMLPLWLLLLDENRGRTELIGLATKDVERVEMDPRATPVQKGEAKVVRGLALRNAEKFGEAKTVLEAARGAVDKGEWAARANAALEEASHPTAYFAQQAQELYDRGRMEAAMAVLERALKILPAKEQGRLLAQRSVIELDAARSKAKKALTASDPLIDAARKDAAAAVKAGLAEGHYAAGRIAEALGQVNAAIRNYRAAVAAHGEQLDAEGARYRMALARVLLQPRAARPAGQPVSWRSPARYPSRHFEDMKSGILLVTLGLQTPLLPGEEPGLQEAEKLADEVLKAPRGTVPFNVLAQALAVKGRWSAALETYVEGIRPMLPRQYGNGLVYLLRNDPRLKRPDSLRTPNPFEAEKHFAAGLNFYFARAYANAEKEFLLTVENNSRDARFFYFLGLSRLAQGSRRVVSADFETAAMLEHVNLPSPAEVSQSLERIQGPTRRFINEFRERP